MNNNFSLTAHMLLCNEEKWVRLAILSALPFVEKLIIFDTGSTDKTIKIVKQIKSEKIIFQEKGKVNSKELIALRNEQIEMTRTDWFMLIDGDEVYPSKVFEKLNDLNMDKYFGIFLRNHMCVGDVFHRLPEDYGKYQICGHYGHLNMKFYRKHDSWKWWGEFPLEYYGDEKGNSINQMCGKLQFLDDYYWHMSFLERSRVKSRNHIKYHLGEKIKDKLPEVFNGEVLKKRSLSYFLRAVVESPLRAIKNKYKNEK